MSVHISIDYFYWVLYVIITNEIYIDIHAYIDVYSNYLYVYTSVQYRKSVRPVNEPAQLNT